MTLLLAAHLCAALVAPWALMNIGRRVFWILACVPGAAFVWALAQTPVVFSGNPPVEVIRWVPGLALTLPFRLDPLSWMMTLIVTGVGALVLVYCSRYFPPAAAGMGRFAGVFVGFAGAMLGVVTVDHMLGVYVFWELTSVLSYMLIGHHFDRRPARAAARQALLLTSSGALAMFAGFVMVGETAGTYRMSQIVEKLVEGSLDPVNPVLIVAAVLIALGAFSKSALVPFHFWLPGAMAAPTPVSAYLHAAAMVKAGVYLVARLTPGLTLVPGWSPLIVAVGCATMLIGGYRSLRQHDLKLVLAYGTVSQLGLMTAALGYGSSATMLAGLVLLVAHSCFKSALFLTVGTVEQVTGTRDLRELSGLGRRAPLLAVVAALAGASMAGLPLTTGYLGKEAFIYELLHGTGAGWTGGSHGFDLAVLAILTVGSMLTVAYTWRFWWGAFGTRGSVAPETVKRSKPSMVIPISVLACGALLGLVPHFVEHFLMPVTEGNHAFPTGGHIALWSGIGPAAVTAVILGGGVILAIAAQWVEAWQERHRAPVAIVDLYAWTLRELEIIAARVTAMVQRGSLPWDLSTITVVLIIAVGGSLALNPPQSAQIRLFDSAIQVVIAILVIFAAILTTRSRRRTRAVFALSAVGLGIVMLFASQGAPDLALTQLVVEAVSMVVFILVMRKLPRYFSDRPLPGSRWWRLAVALMVGMGVVVAGLYASSARVHQPVSELMPHEAVNFGHGLNIVNVILVDIRAWDTIGEISVLLVIAMGVAALIHAGTHIGTVDRAPKEVAKRERFLPAAGILRPESRSVVLEVTVRLLFPTLLLLSIWLLLIGHNNPGGGFAGGVIAGLAFVLRYLAGGRWELGEAMPIPPARILGAGLFTAGAGAMAPLAFGNSVLQSTAVDIHLGPIGDLHFTTAMVLDVGVYLVVLGVILQMVSATGAEIDRQTNESRDEQAERAVADEKALDSGEVTG